MTARKSEDEFVKIGPRKTFISFFTGTLGLILSGSLALAGSATWLATPANNDWNTAGNWTPGGPPNGAADVATFQFSPVNNLSLSADTQISGITFGAGGGTPYTITASPAFALTLSGSGITNSSGITQSFVAAGNNGRILFVNTSNAGFNTVFITSGGAISGEVFGITQFRDSANAGQAIFTTNGGTVSGAFGGVTQFFDSSTAGNGSFTNNGGTASGAGSGATLFFDMASAGKANFATNGSTLSDAGGGFTVFFDNSTAGAGTFTNSGGNAPLAPGGVTQFFDSSTAGNGAFTINGGAVSGGSGAVIQFFDLSTAANGNFTTNGGMLTGEGGGTVEFLDSSTAGNGAFTTNGSTANFAAPGNTRFFDSSTAGNGTFITNGGKTNGEGGGGVTEFVDSSSAGQATFTTNGAPVGDGAGGIILFRNSSSADNGMFTFNGSGIAFAENATAANATLIANGDSGEGDGSSILFFADSTGGTARVKVFGKGRLDISSRGNPGVTIGSLEGTGAVFLGMNTLSVGSNDLSTIFSGMLQDGGINGQTGGSLTKIGRGTLILSGMNTYTGATEINEGMLRVDGSITSAATVNNAGTLGGSGTTGSVTVSSGGTIAPHDQQTLHINGDYAQNSGGVLTIDVVGTDPSASGHLDIKGNAIIDGTLEVRFRNGFLPASGQVFRLLHVAGAFAGSFAQIIFPDLRAGFQFQAEFVNGTYQITALNDGVTAVGFLNISTRLRVDTGDNALIGGFLVTGNAPKKVIIRAIGPSLAPLPGRLSDPTLELRDSAGGMIFANDNWVESLQVQEIIDSTIPPNDDLEAAIVATLTPGSYTAVMRGVNNTIGIGLMEVYDLAPNVLSRLANISSRGLVETGDSVMIGGFIVDNQASHVIVRALGPSLTPFGIPNALSDPNLSLHDSQGAIIAFNDDWQETNQAAIEATGIPPSDENESAILATVAPGNYTAIVRGQDDTTGVGLVEVYNLQ